MKCEIFKGAFYSVTSYWEAEITIQFWTVANSFKDYGILETNYIIQCVVKPCLKAVPKVHTQRQGEKPCVPPRDLQTG